MAKMTTITIDNVSNREDGERKAERLRMLTKGNYHDFKYAVCPVGGSFDIVVSSYYEFEGEDSQKEMLETFVCILAMQI